MANATAPILSRDGTVTLATADGTPKTVSCTYHNGNTSIDEMIANQREVVEGMHRGSLIWFRYGNVKPFEVTFDVALDQFVGDGSTTTLFEIVKKAGTCASSTSKLPTSTGDVWAIQATFAWERSNFGATGDNSIVWKYCIPTISVKEGDPTVATVKLRVLPYSTDWEAYT